MKARVRFWKSLATALVFANVAARAEDVSVSLRSLGPHRYELNGSFRTPASRDAAWVALTDYERIPGFVNSMRYSRIKERAPNYVLLEQESLGRAFVFRHTIHVLLKVSEEPRRRVAFQDVSRACFESYEGEWRLEDAGGETAVFYRLAVTEGPALPWFVPKTVVLKTARGLLRNVASEMTRRSGT
jgi:hypothetical protein